MKEKLMTADDVRALLRDECDAAGSPAKWAKQHGYTRALLSYVLSGQRKITDRFAKELGLRIVYVKIPVDES